MSAPVDIANIETANAENVGPADSELEHLRSVNKDETTVASAEAVKELVTASVEAVEKAADSPVEAAKKTADASVEAAMETSDASVQAGKETSDASVQAVKETTDAPVDSAIAEASTETSENSAETPVATTDSGKAPPEEEVKQLTKEEQEENLKQMIASGKREMALNALEAAADIFSRASELTSTLFGEDSEEMFEPLYLYGQILLDLARSEDQVLANTEKLEAVEEEDGDQEEKSDENGDVEMKESEGEEQEQKEEGEEEGAEAEESPMTLAWESLEAVRVLCNRMIKKFEGEEVPNVDSLKTWKLRLAEVLSSLGEHGIADNKGEQAQKDLFSALELQALHLPNTSRLLANTNHLIGKAFSTDYLFDKAADHFTTAKDILTLKQEELKSKLEAASGDEKKDIEEEIKELDVVIPDIEKLLIDAKESFAQLEKMKETAKKELEDVAETLTKVGADVEVNDIQNLVRRKIKRPASIEPADDIKKAKTDAEQKEQAKEDAAAEEADA
ncbi:unnamed protein product [Caenorhabditis sp. 36 PRJEB53466]|nr:unnamed protein product [Caenorhabditis sp. 36 PRJEB53466]